MWLKSINYNFTGVQASGVIIVYCDSAVLYGPKIIGPHSSGNFNDWLLKLKAGSKIWMVAMGQCGSFKSLYLGNRCIVS